MKNLKIVGILLVVAAIAGGVLLYQRYSLPQRGERAFQRLGCGGCHFSGAGPNLTHVVRRQDPKFLEQFIANPPAVYRQRGMRPLNDGYMLMPDMHASPDDAAAIVAYLHDLDKEKEDKQ
ncbi:MAG TPA: cytochrome c [Terriglobales bacterium]|nr:cytochrome c [Terriglobales bacterium]